MRDAIADYYNSQYGSNVEPENVMVFAGGRPGIYTVMAFLKERVKVRIGNIEWPAYLDIMEQTKTEFEVVPFTKENGFHPSNELYFDRSDTSSGALLMPVISNPQNPSGQTRSGEELRELIQMAELPGNGILLDLSLIHI